MAGAISLQRQPEAQERLPFVRKSGNSGKNSNGTVHPSGMFSEKNGYTFGCITFFSPAFIVTTDIFCTIFFRLQEPGFLWRESERFTGIL